MDLKVFKRLHLSPGSGGKYDPVTTLKIGQYEILLYKSHQLPKILKRWPEYSENLARLVKIVQKKYNDVQVLDVGANVGDSVAIIKSEVDVPIVCIEGYDKYFKLLQRNLALFDNVYSFELYFGEKSRAVNSDLREIKGTMSMQKSSSSGENISIISLDDFVSQHPEFWPLRVLKIDTDGMDLNIIQGGFSYIKKIHPVIFFEFDFDAFNLTEKDGWSVFHSLGEFGYDDILFFDNVGRFLLSTTIDNKRLLAQLYHYTRDKRGQFDYYDLCLFHRKDRDIASQLVQNELERP